MEESRERGVESGFNKVLLGNSNQDGKNVLQDKYVTDMNITNIYIYINKKINIHIY